MKLDLTAKTVIGAVALLAVAGGGYWLGQRPREVSSSEEAANPPNATGQQTETAVGNWVLQKQFTGPLKDTVVQRWRDPDTGILCYIYLPVIVQHSQPLQNGMVHYGNAGTGSISCVQQKS